MNPKDFLEELSTFTFGTIEKWEGLDNLVEDLLHIVDEEHIEIKEYKAVNKSCSNWVVDDW